MPQNPVKTTLFVSKIVAGSNVTLSPTSGTGIVTVNVTGSSYNPASVAITGGTIDGAVIGGTTPAAVTATTLTAPPTGTFVLNGATPVTVADAAITANSNIIITLKTVGGTVGPQPHVATITPTTGFTVVGTALDTSTYNYLVIG